MMTGHLYCLYHLQETKKYGKGGENALTSHSRPTSQSLHVWYSHSQNGQFVRFACQGAAGGDHVAEFVDVGGHLVATPTLDLAVAFSVTQQGRLAGERQIA